MTLNFQNRIVFPAPVSSYTTQSAFGQVIYVPRNIMQQVDKKLNQTRRVLSPSAKKTQSEKIEQIATSTGDKLDGEDNSACNVASGAPSTITAADNDDETARDDAFLQKSQMNMNYKASQVQKHLSPVIIDSDTLDEPDDSK